MSRFQPVTVEMFKAELAQFPSGVVVASTRDRKGSHWGLTASSFCSVSLDPPLVLICIARSAQCAPVFDETDWFAISVLSEDQERIARKFATRGAPKFAEVDTLRAPNGCLAVSGSLSAIECQVYGRYDGGDHTILVGRVESIAAGGGGGVPLAYWDRKFVRVLRELER